jgi:Kdo2-lipid IVA lauroyltransferase/acyltransferase
MIKIRRVIRRRIKKLSHPFTCGMVLFLGFLVRKLSRQSSRKLADKLGSVAYDHLKIRRRLVERNLAMVFPEKTEAEIQGIARKIYQNQVLNVIELLRIPLIKNREDAQDLVEINPGCFIKKTRDQGKGAVLVSAHLGSWEVLALCTGLLLTPVHVIAKPLKNSYFDAHLNQWRTMHGNKIIYKDQALREGIKILRQGGVVGILGDQSNRKGTYLTQFLGRESTIFLGPAFLALKAGVPVFIETCKRLDNGKYLLEIVEIPTDDLKCSKEDIKELTRRYTRALEDFIRSNPEEWLWLHDRWKTAPQSGQS